MYTYRYYIMLCKTKLIYHFWKLNRRQFLACQVSAKPRTYEAETGAGCVIGILTMGLLSLFNWVGFHPLYTLHNEIFVHVKRVLRSPQQHFPPENGWLEYLFRFGMAYFQV